MQPEQPMDAALRFEADRTGLRPDDIRNCSFPIVRRGYDRERVDRFLARVAEAHSSALTASSVLRQRLNALEEDVVRAEDEAAASARAVAELMRAPPGRDAESRQALEELEQRLEQSERERDQALADLRELAQREAEVQARPDAPVGASGQQPEGPGRPAADSEAARLLVAAARAADDVRDAARARALRTLQKARALSALVHEQAERERAELEEARERRRNLDREANEVLARARVEAERIAAALEDERERARNLLAGVLASLEAEPATSPSAMIDDLESRLNERTGSAAADQDRVIAGPHPSEDVAPG